MIDGALMLTPTDALAIGLACLTAVQIAKLVGMPSTWAAPVAVILGGVIGIATGISNDVGWESWLSLWYEGAIGGLTGIGVYSAGSAMSGAAEKRKAEQAAKARAAKRATPKPPPAPPMAGGVP